MSLVKSMWADVADHLESDFLVTPTPPIPFHTKPERMVPLLVSPDLEKESGAMFDQKGFAVLPTPKVTEDAHRGAFLAESQQLVDRALRV